VHGARRGYRTPNAGLLIALLVVVVGAIVYLSRRSSDPPARPQGDAQHIAPRDDAAASGRPSRR